MPKTKTSGKVEETASKAVKLVQNNKNTVLIIGGLFLAGFLAYKINKSASGIFGEPIKKGKELKENPQLPPSGLSDTQAKTRAEVLYEAMYSAGTDEVRVFDALKDITHNDFIKISEYFGERRYNPVTGEGSFFPFPAISLMEWLAQELNDEEFAQLHKNLPDIF